MKALIIDGNSILNRSFYGIKLLSTKKGQFTNAVYGFLTTLQKIKEEFNPDVIVSAFDLPEPTFRKEIFKEYKAQRKGMPDELASQLPILKEILILLGYKIVECSGFEADDILGTLSYNFSNQGHECLIATGDRDSLQLVSDNVTVRISSTKAGKSEAILYNADKIKEAYGVLPKELIEIKALQGDTSDNIPGVKGIGQKTAESLIQKFNSIDNIYDNIDSLDIKENIKKKLIDGKENAYMSRSLGTIRNDVPIEVNISEYLVSSSDLLSAKNLMLELELHSLIDKFFPKALDLPDNKNMKCMSVNVNKNLEDLLNELKSSKKISIHLEFSENDIAYIAIFNLNKLHIVRNEGNSSFEFIKLVLENQDISKVVYDYKKLIVNISKFGIEIKNCLFDVMLAAYILNPSASDYKLDRLCEEYNIDNFSIENSNDCNETEIKSLKCVCALHELETKFAKELSENGQLELLFDIEIPLSKVLANMELLGFEVDGNGLSGYSKVLTEKILQLQKNIYSSMGFEFNINSPKQLGIALFEDLGLPKGKKGKTGYSTNAKVLEGLAKYHPAINMILEYRTLSKLKSTYCDGMIKLIENDGRIHAYFNQIETRTGRISCAEPNLQNIPVRTEIGREFRKYFRAKNGCILIDADYSQIELRVLAHLSGDESMMDAFNSNQDIHTLTAAGILNLPVEMINYEARTRAKAVNFGIIYGIGAFSLAQDLGITRAEADKYIKAYLNKYRGVDKYMTEMVEIAKSQGYVETMFHRRRYLPELSSSNFNLRSFGERVARNMPIQGTAADIIKIAMIKVNKKLKDCNLKSQIILQVHDELIVETLIDEADKVKTILKEEMENAVMLNVPLIVNISQGETWYDTKD